MKTMLKQGMAVLGLFLGSLAHGATDWSAQDYDVYPGDFNGDGKQDLLYVAKDPAKISGIALSDGTAPNTPWQTWPSNYLGIPWSGNQYTAIVADFNGDGKADILMQRATAGDSYLLLADSGGKIVAISQTIASGALGLNWSADQHKLLAGDINNDGKADLFFQATGTSGTHAVVYADAGGTFTIAPTQTWSDSYLGLNWSTQSANVFLADFNGDRRADLLVQAKPKFVMIDYDITFPVPTYPPNMNGMVYSIGGASPYNLAYLRAWSRMNNGVDWSPLTNSLLVGDFNGDGRADVLFQAKYSSGTNSILNGNATGAAFPATATTITTSTVPLSSDSNQVIVGNFDGGAATGIYIQALTAGGTNYAANSVGGTVTATIHNPNTATGTVPATAVGHTTGSFAVSNSGAATYSIPIIVPPGVSGIQPSLAISYQSGGGNGYLGMGWNIGGLSQIERCRKTLAQDGSNGAVTLTATDVFCLDGNRLRLTSAAGTYGQTGSTYQTEMETFSRVTANGTAGTGPAWFKVEGKNGLIYEYGNTADSRIESINASYIATARVWLLNKVSDRAGNTMVFSYIEDGAPNGSFRPNEVNYTSNTSAGLAAAYKVKFIWEARSAADTLSGYFAGGLVKDTNRLNRIETQYNDPTLGIYRLVRKYQLGYRDSANSTRTLLGSVQECDGAGRCLSPTTINWQSSESVWGVETASGADPSALMDYAQAIDIDSDGRTDLVYPQPVSGGVNWFYMLANSSGVFSVPVNTGISAGDTTNIQYSHAYAGNFLGDGQAALLVTIPSYSNRQLLKWNGSGLARVATNISTTFTGREWIGDFDGDGKTDFLYGVMTNTPTQNYITFYEKKNAGLINEILTFAAAQNFYYGTSSGSFEPGGYASSMRLLDFNGDGRTDVIYDAANVGVYGADSLIRVLASTGTSFVATQEYYCEVCDGQSSYGDLNGDGLTDVLFATAEGGSFGIVLYGTGTGFVEGSAHPFSVSYFTKSFIADFDGDGREDVFYANGDGAGNWMVARSNGNGFDPAINTGVASPNNGSLRPMDIDGDGLIDIGYQSSQFKVRRHKGSFPDLVSSVTDGFGNNVTLTYAPLTDSSVYTKGAGAAYPEMDLQFPMLVVKQYSMTTGIADPAASDGTYTVTERYTAARANLQGRGLEGFASRTETDIRTGIQTVMTFNQVFPKAGSIASVTVKQPNGKTISLTTTTYTDLVTNSAQYNDRHYVYPSSTTQTSYEVSASNAGLDGAPVKSVTTTQTGVDAYGNPGTVTTTTTDQTNTSQVFTAATSNAYINDVTNWCLGFVTDQQVTTSVPNAAPLAGGAAPTRKLKFEPDADATKCRVFRQTLQPAASDQVVTTFEFDLMGHVKKTTLSATGIADRIAQVSYGPQGVYPVQFTNAVGEVSYKTYDYALGLPLTAKDPNGLEASWQYDGFGRKTRANAPDGTATTWALSACTLGNGYCGDGLLRYRVQQQQLDGSASHNVMRTDVQYFDALNRALYSQSQTFSGAFSVVSSIYNNKGQLTKRSVPYFQGFSPTYTTTSYDLVGRLTKIERRVSESDASLQMVEYTYAKLVETVKDPLAHTSTKTTNAIGQVVQMQDANGSITQYQYDALGNLAKTTDSAGNIISSAFNLRGFKMSSSDPDMGNWSYDYYPSGELKTQTDAKGQTATFTYDNISRPKTRVEPEGTTTWNYGNSAVAHNIGQLDYVCMGTAANCVGQTYREAYTYDSLGRPQNITYTEDTTYQVDYTYNNQGTLDTLTYPTSTAGYRLKLQYAYNNGQLSQIRDFSAGTQFWTLNATNAANQILDERMANGVRIISGFDAISSAMVYRQSGNVGSTSNLQNLSYQWDKAGNLKQRQDTTQNLTEVFNYDALNRLDNSTLNGVQNLDVSVNAIGNLTTKSDASASAYDYTTAQAGCTYYTHAQPHAVRKIGSNVYCYDANGNMTKRAGSTIAWTSYNLPSQINSGSNFSQFSYGPSRQRWKQVANYGGTVETTMYVGGLIEKVTRGTVTEYKHYIAGGSATAIYTRRSDNTTSTYYVTSDHLGSADVITDGTGAAVVRESFAAYGARRGSNWSGSPSAADQAQFTATTHRGYTGHEMLDNLSLIHMNGRVYDPQIGRFISADPYIQAPMNQQSLNRYSYVQNGPMSATDPSGYWSLGKYLNPFDDDNPIGLRSFAGRAAFGFAAGLLPFADYNLTKANDRYLLKHPELQPYVTLIVTAVVSIYGTPAAGAWVSAGLNAHFTRINGGSNGDILKAFVVSYATSYAFNAAGEISNPVLNTMAHAAIGCASAAAGGGNCGQGALSAGFGAAFSKATRGMDALRSDIGRFLGPTIAGGIAAELGGGDFIEGAKMAGMGYLFNELIHWEKDLFNPYAATKEFKALMTPEEELAINASILMADNESIPPYKYLTASDLGLPGNRKTFYEVYFVGNSQTSPGRLARLPGSDTYFYSRYHYKPGVGAPNVWVMFKMKERE